MKSLTIVASSGAEVASVPAASAIATTDLLLVLRLWSVIDVYGRVRRASAAEDCRAYRAGDAVA